jgi:hypothetical protein
MQLLAKDHRLTHMFAFRAERRVFSYGVTTLALLSAAVLLLVDADTQRLLPVFAIGVLIGFTFSQPPGKCHARGGLTLALSNFRVSAAETKRYLSGSLSSVDYAVRVGDGSV